MSRAQTRNSCPHCGKNNMDMEEYHDGEEAMCVRCGRDFVFRETGEESKKLNALPLPYATRTTDHAKQLYALYRRQSILRDEIDERENEWASVMREIQELERND